MSSKKVVLFDMDGTLTPPRKQMGIDVIYAIPQLISRGFEVGIVTGSDIDYIKEQAGNLLKNLLTTQINSFHLLPCNGTKRYDAKLNLLSEVNMINEFGQDKYNSLILYCLERQAELIKKYKDLPLTGSFLQYRGSMLNWCPIGRSSGDSEREVWSQLDAGNIIRLEEIHKARRFFENNGLANLTINLGGDTSFDIFPKGWDKTYALRHFKYYEIYFIGDRCFDDGNDRAIYDACLPNAYSTSGPEQTIKIIDSIK